MARFEDRRKIDVGKDGAIYLNEPTVKELNQHTNDSVSAKGRKTEVKRYTASVKLFDSTFDEAVKVEVPDGKGGYVQLTKDNLELVPARRKSDCVHLAFFSGDDDINADGAEGEEEDGDGDAKN